MATQNLQIRTNRLRDRLKAAKVQPSASRLAIADYVLETEDHPTAEEVKIAVEKNFPSLCMATVYNTLNLFEERGLIISLRDPQTKVVRFDSRTEPHFHFVDETSGQLYDLDPRALRVVPTASMLQDGVRIKSIDVVIRGELPEDADFILTRSSDSRTRRRTKTPTHKGVENE